MTLSTSSSQRSHWLARTLVSLTLLTVGAQAACVSLATSTLCPSYAKFSVDTKAAANINGLGMGINMAAFTNLATFEAAVMNTTAFFSSSTCTGYTSAERVRYQNTVLCLLATQDSDSAKCTSNAPDVCATSCSLFASSLSAMISKNCPTDKTSLTSLTSLNNTCNGQGEWYGLQSTATTCINAQTDEAATCGFGSQKDMCTFCTANPTDSCCATTGAVCLTPTTTASTTASTIVPPTPSTSNSADDGSTSKSGLSTAALGGIIAGGVVVLLLLFAGVVCCIRRSKPKNTNHGNKALARHVSSSSASKYNISAPKIQEEGFAAALAPSIPMTALPSNGASEAAAAAAAAAAANRVSKASSAGGAKPSYCQALYPYQASMADELDMSPGDLINVHRVFDDGWAVGVNMNTSNEGAFPVVCVMFVDENALDDDFEDVNMHSMTPMGLREDDMKSSARASLQSRASSPVNLPRRHSSMIRDSVILPGINSPMKGSPLAGANSNNSSQQRGYQSTTPVRDTMMSDASSINRWWEGEGSSK